jgi:hypothetical protein
MHSFLLAHQLRKRLLEQPAGVSPRFMIAGRSRLHHRIDGGGIERETGVEPWTALSADGMTVGTSLIASLLARNYEG